MSDADYKLTFSLNLQIRRRSRGFSDFGIVSIRAFLFERHIFGDYFHRREKFLHGIIEEERLSYSEWKSLEKKARDDIARNKGSRWQKRRSEEGGRTGPALLGEGRALCATYVAVKNGLGKGTPGATAGTGRVIK